MSEAVTIALISALALILSGVFVELVRARRRQDTVVAQVTPNDGRSLRDAVDRVAAEIKEVRTEQSRAATRLAVVEARISDYLIKGS